MEVERQKTMTGALDGIRVVELAETPSGEYCGKILAELGAQVIKIERPRTGSPTRLLGGGNGALFAYLNTDKDSVELDLETEAGLDAAMRLLESASVAIDDRSAERAAALGLSPADLAARYPSLVACLITPFGMDAPTEWNAAEAINVFHASGWGYHTPSTPDPSRPPLKGAGCYNADIEGGIDAAIAILACLVRLGRTGEGEFIDVSQQMALLSRNDTMIGRFLNGEDNPRPGRDALDMPGPAASYACADGHVYLFTTSQAHWKGLRALLGEPAWMGEFEDNWLEFGVTPERVATFRRNFADWMADKPKLETCDAAQKLGTPLVPLNSAADLPASPQFIHRRFFEPLEHPELGKALYPTLPFLLSEGDPKPRRAAPGLGEGDAEQSAQAMRSVFAGAAANGSAPDTARGGPLAGIRIVELTKVWAGPYAGKLLAFLGAEVIKVESEFNLDEMRAYGGIDINNAPFFLSLNNEVLSAQFNLKHPEGLTALRKLISQSDVVLNNLRPGAMERSGLGYDGLRELRDDIISVSLKMYGNDGPLGYQTGYAPCFAALGGMSYVVGYEGEPPRNVCIRYGDATAGAFAALGALAALVHRERTGRGQFVDVSAVEAMAAVVGDGLLRYSLTGELPAPDGNRHPDMAPHGVYPAADGRWISIAVSDEDAWRALCGELGEPALVGDPRFDSLGARQENLADLDSAITRLTESRDALELAERLRSRGVGAFVSANTIDIASDPHLWENGYYIMAKDSAKDVRPILGPSWHMARGPADVSCGSPRLGAQNAYVFGTILGYSEAKQQALAEASALR
jgi:crotonobetainyl-CoA:carnitine CoA-transferase CaiB-like acyl-CoA transferase